MMIHIEDDNCGFGGYVYAYCLCCLSWWSKYIFRNLEWIKMFSSLQARNLQIKVFTANKLTEWYFDLCMMRTKIMNHKCKQELKRSQKKSLINLRLWQDLQDLNFTSKYDQVLLSTKLRNHNLGKKKILRALVVLRNLTLLCWQNGPSITLASFSWSWQKVLRFSLFCSNTATMRRWQRLKRVKKNWNFYHNAFVIG